MPWHPSTTQSRDLLLTALGFAERSSWGNIPIFGELRHQVSASAQHLCKGGADQCQSGQGAKAAAWPPTHPALCPQSPSKRHLWDSKRKPWVNRAKYQLTTCTLQPPAALRECRAQCWPQSPSGGALVPCSAQARRFWGSLAPAELTLHMERGMPMPSISACGLFFLHQTHSCGKPQGTWTFNILTSVGLRLHRVLSIWCSLTLFPS